MMLWLFMVVRGDWKKLEALFAGHLTNNLDRDSENGESGQRPY